MLSVRSMLRSAPRVLPRLTALAARPSAAVFRNTARLQASWTPTFRTAAAPFSTSIRRFEANEELVAKLQSEIDVEENLTENPSERGDVKEYLEGAGRVWTLHDDAGTQEVKLTRTYNDENIEVSFSVAEITSMGPESGMNDQDTAYDDAEDYDEPVSAQSGGANTKGSINQGKTSGGNVRVAPEDSVAPADRPELDDEEGAYPREGQQSQSFPVRLLVKITKNSQPGAMEVEAVATDGDIVIENVNFYPDPKLADAQDAEGEFKRRTIYAGPRYDNLDVELQDLMDRFLEERGIDTELSLWLPDFVDFKEQKEYVRWLQNVKSFLS